MTIILGIDPGLQHTGWGVIRSEGNRLSFVACGTISTKAKAPLAERLQHLHTELQLPISSYAPVEAAIEDTFVNKNALSSLKLGHARGVLMMSVSLAGLPVSEYAATQVKKAVTGVGRGDKTQVTMMVQQLLPGATIDSEHAADALAIAICHAHMRQTLAHQLPGDAA